MRAVTQLLVLATLAAVASKSDLLAQARKEPKRPTLTMSTDTNSAAEYYLYGESVIPTDPRKAADAFYWASRLDPTWAQPLYARRVALLIASDRSFLVGYMDGKRGYTRSKEARSIDSLELRALMLSPYLDRELDKELLLAYVRALFESLGYDRAASLSIEYFAERYWRTQAPPGTRARLAVSEHRFQDALDLYREALSQARDDTAYIHEARARVFFLSGNGDSARAEMERAVNGLREKDVKDFVYFYESKAVLEHSIGLIDERQSKLEPAREAYGRALQEDLSYYPAHVRLGILALARSDTATALSELDLAAQIKGDDPWVQTTYGATLAQTGHLAEAESHLRKAVELEPLYAAPYYVLGRLAETAGKAPDAIADYRAYLAHARAKDPRVVEVQRRLSDLAALVGPNR